MCSYVCGAMCSYVSFMNEANLGARSGRAAAKVEVALFDATLAAILLFSLS